MFYQSKPAPPLAVEALEYDGTAECAERIGRWSQRAFGVFNGVAQLMHLKGTTRVTVGDWVVRHPARGLMVLTSRQFEANFDTAPEAGHGTICTQEPAIHV